MNNRKKNLQNFNDHNKKISDILDAYQPSFLKFIFTVIEGKSSMN